MNETDTTTQPSRKQGFQFRIATLLWLMVVVAAFFAGRYTALPETTDEIATTWNPGVSVPIAISGPVDLDGDGSDDLAALKKLILKNGGTVVASENRNGSVSGKIDAATRYLVVEDPTDPAIASNKLVTDAKKLSIPLVSTKKLLQRMGVKPKQSASGFRSRAN